MAILTGSAPPPLLANAKCVFTPCMETTPLHCHQCTEVAGARAAEQQEPLEPGDCFPALVVHFAALSSSAVCSIQRTRNDFLVTRVRWEEPAACSHGRTPRERRRQLQRRPFLPVRCFIYSSHIWRRVQKMRSVRFPSH